mmetsp:Transcript_4960/g.20444  ORF Transcript_4960/g.20444 Transcript_4960/m.20444 type:complete len:221 (+) Transcript_4960:4713-5375(+)
MSRDEKSIAFSSSGKNIATGTGISADISKTSSENSIGIGWEPLAIDVRHSLPEGICKANFFISDFSPTRAFQMCGVSSSRMVSGRLSEPCSLISFMICDWTVNSSCEAAVLNSIFLCEQVAACPLCLVKSNSPTTASAVTLAFNVTQTCGSSAVTSITDLSFGSVGKNGFAADVVQVELSANLRSVLFIFLLCTSTTNPMSLATLCRHVAAWKSLSDRKY